jgi:hypothetical protein
MPYPRVFALTASLALFGCHTTPVALQDAASIPPDRLLAFQTQKGPDAAILLVTRDDGLMGSGCFVTLRINGVLSAKFELAEKARFVVPPGETLLRVSLDGRGLCSFNADYWTQRETILRPGETKTFRISTDAGGKVDINRSD